MIPGRVVEWSTKGCIWIKVLVKWGVSGRRQITVDQDHASRLGHFLRSRREELGLSARALARAVGVRDSTILRIEGGRYAAPGADKLARIAQHLRLDLADVYAMANYVIPTSLPSLPHYLSVRYPRLTPETIDAINGLLRQEEGRSSSPLTPSAGGK